MFERNWNLNISIPLEHQERISRSILMGTIDLNVTSEDTTVLLCAQPKSASLYLNQVIAASLEFENHQIGFNQGGGAVYYPRILAAKFTGKNTISHCHAAPEPNIIKLIEMLDLRPLILSRNLLDALISRRDMLLKDKWARNILSPNAINKFVNSSKEYQIDVIIDLFAADYINFFTGWDQFRNNQQIKPIYITYEEMVRDQLGLLSYIAKELNVAFNATHTSDIMNKIQSRGGINFNKGVTGRGRSLISDPHIEKLRRLALKLGCENEDFLGFNLEKPTTGHKETSKIPTFQFRQNRRSHSL